MCVFAPCRAPLTGELLNSTGEQWAGHRVLTHASSFLSTCEMMHGGRLSGTVKAHVRQCSGQTAVGYPQALNGGVRLGMK